MTELLNNNKYYKGLYKTLKRERTSESDMWRQRQKLGLYNFWLKGEIH